MATQTLTGGARGGDAIGHPFQSNPQIDTSKITVADNPTSPLSCTVNGKQNPDAPLMKAAAWHAKHDVQVVERQRPMLTDPEDVILKVTSTAICGSDLHLYEGYMLGMQKGDIMGHEFMGVVEDVGPNVKNVKKGDRVVVSFDIGCGRCSYCKGTMYSSCATTNPSADMEAMYGHRSGGFFGYSHMTGGWQGGQAEYVRVPMADVNTIKVPDNLPDEKVLFLSDILPTAWHGCEMGEVGPTSNVAIWGAGPVGILAAMCAFNRGAKRVVLIDNLQYRLDWAQNAVKGVEVINYKETRHVDKHLREMFPEFQGPDVCIECVGFHYAKTLLHTVEQKLMMENDPADILNEMIRSVRKGGCISIIGAYAGYTNHFNIGAFMEKCCTMRGGQCPVQRYWHDLLKKIESGEMDPTKVITHVLPLDQARHAYEIFNNKKDNCIKTVLAPNGV